MSEFIIERELENVRLVNTREYLNEVISSYNNGNYRSAVVVLYSIVIFDLLQKLRILKEIYHDDTATSILKDVEESQKEHPRNPKWERILIEGIKERTKLINAVEYEKINQLYFDRNISAHPLYNYEYKLINPNREQVRAHIRNMFEAVFIKDAILSKKIMEDLLDDSLKYYESIGVENLKDYIESKYYSKMIPEVKRKVFKGLWKFAFTSNEEKCVKNRKLLVLLMVYLVDKNKILLFDELEEHIEYYSNIQLSDNIAHGDYWSVSIYDSKVTSMISFLSYYPGFYKPLNEPAKLIIEAEAKKHINYFIYAYFLSDTINEHLEKLHKMHKDIYVVPGWTDTYKYTNMKLSYLVSLHDKTLEIDSGRGVLVYAIIFFGGSPSYSSASTIFNLLIEKLLHKFEKNDYILLYEKMNQNSQIYDNHDKEMFLHKVKEYSVLRLDKNFNYSKFGNLY